MVRVMPNTPALVDEGMAAISPGSHCDAEHLARAEALLSATGKVIQVAEYHQDAVTAISGSGPAYIFYVVEAMIEAGVLLGLPRSTSTELVVQTLYGAATMLKETGDAPDGAARAGLQPGRDDDGGAAPARRPQGARGVPDGDGGGAQPFPGAVLRLRLTSPGSPASRGFDGRAVRRARGSTGARFDGRAVRPR